MAEAVERKTIIVNQFDDEDAPPQTGSWKLAYADFVTAMMAFFLLLWLLSSSESEGLKGVSEFFNTPSKLVLLGGDAPSNVPSHIESRGFARVPGNSHTKNDLLTRSKIAYDTAQFKKETIELQAVQQKIQASMQQTPGLKELQEQIRLEVTPEGLYVQITDEQNRPMFRSGGSDLMPHMKQILAQVGQVVSKVSNRIAVYGHTDAVPYPNNARGYSNWELSTDRANSTRKELMANGVPDANFYQINGFASSRPVNAEDPKAAVNRRIDIVLLRKTSVDDVARTEGLYNQKPSASNQSIEPGIQTLSGKPIDPPFSPDTQFDDLGPIRQDLFGPQE